MRALAACLLSTASHLFAPMTSARPSSAIRRAIARSCLCNSAVASISKTQRCAYWIARNASSTIIFSTLSAIRARRRMPAVSTRRYGWSRHVNGTSMASRVMPASGPVKRRSSPIRLLISVDLPIFGRPTTAMRIGSRTLSSCQISIGLPSSSNRSSSASSETALSGDENSRSSSPVNTLSSPRSVAAASIAS